MVKGTIILDQHDRIDIGADVELFPQLFANRRLEGCELKSIVAVVSNDKIYRVIAKIADSVKQHDRAHITILSHMIRHSDISDERLRELIKKGELLLGGNAVLMIYGRLDCKSGKRLHKANRVFFVNETEARHLGFRPCGNCLRSRYLEWKSSRG